MYTSNERQLFDSHESGNPIAMARGEVHLWCAHYGEMRDERLLAYYWTLLSGDERKQQQRFHFEKDRLRYLVTRALVRLTLSRYAPVEPCEWNFVANAYGRPEARYPAARSPRLKFNLSHTDHLIVLAVTAGRAVGVDVENIRVRDAPIGIADRYFAADEVAALKRVSHVEQQRRFFEYWTFKEAYIKARGMGLSLPLDKFSFHLAEERSVSVRIDPELNDHATRWQLWQFAPAPEYLAALCVERHGLLPATVVLREVMPGVRERVLRADFTRVSRVLMSSELHAEETAC
ncbi:MAG: 4'-phosphopantetheinyl transferase superfamily protein [Steroidobacteraceae bacterium]